MEKQGTQPRLTYDRSAASVISGTMESILMRIYTAAWHCELWLFSELSGTLSSIASFAEHAEHISRRCTRPKSNVNATPSTNNNVNEYSNEPVMPMSVGQETEPTAGHFTPTSMNNTPRAMKNMHVRSPKRKSSSIGNEGRGKRIVVDALNNLIDVTGERNALIINLVGDRGSLKESDSSSQQRPDAEVVPSIAECLRDLESIPDLPSDVFIKSMNIFTEPKFRSLFSAMADKHK
ncbi:hypothetical protein Taro_008424, partial [Colocasia esculenta]|nr:hypothetical protein [Colocasia esculenta]